MGVHLPILDPIMQFTVLTAAALVTQLTVERLRLPGLIGLIVIGAAIGPGGGALLPREPVAALLGQVGLVYIMFLAGAEIDLPILKEHKHEATSFGLLSFVLTGSLALAAAVLLDFSWSGALLLATALASHTLVAYPIVKRQGLLGRTAVVSAVGGTLLTDTLALVMLAIVLQTIGRSEEMPWGDAWWGWLAALGLLAGLVVAALLTVPRLSDWIFERSATSRAEKALYVLVALLSLASLAEVIGAEPILGAFLAGACLNQPLRKREELHDHLGFVGRMIFVPFFFIDTGMRIELAVFVEQTWVWVLAATLGTLVLVGKGAAAWIVGWLFNYSRRERWLIFGLTTPQAAATLAVTVTAREAGAFDVEVVDAVVAVIFATCLFGPLVCRMAGGSLAREAERQAAEAEPVEPKKEMPERPEDENQDKADDSRR